MIKLNWNDISNNYIAMRILQLCNGKYNKHQICEIIGSERSLERFFLAKDMEKYITKWEKTGLIFEKNNCLCLEKSEYTEVNENINKIQSRGITRILWDITRKCNLKCHHCYAYKEGDYSEELDLEQMYKAIHDLKKLQPYLIVYGGGEPFVRKDFFDILKETKRVLNCRIKVLTNGTMLTNEVAKKIKNYVDFIQISLDGIEEHHDILRGREGSFNKAIKAINVATEAGIKTGICMTINKYNIEDIDWVMKFALEKKVYKLRISPFVAAGKAINSYSEWIIPHEDLKRIYERLTEYRIKYRSKLLFDFRDELYGNAFLGCIGQKSNENNEYLLCAAGRSLFYINAEGYITPCNFIDNPKYYVGNIKKDNIQRIWEDSELFNSLRNLKVNDIENCSTCKRKMRCGGGLRCNALMTTGDIKAADPFCYFME